MNRLENRLRDALKPEDPVAGFAERVLARTLETRHTPWTGIFARWHLRWGLAAALCLAIMMAAGIEYRQSQLEKARSEAAKAQLMLALRIAGEQLQFAWTKVYQP